MHFIPNSEIKQAMLAEIGLDDIDELFADVPKEVRYGGLQIEKSKSEMQVRREMKHMLSKNVTLDEITSFIGGPAMPHFVPAAVRSITSRSEFYTAYTPYQPELSQGILQAMFEYQSMIAELTGMDVANISMYDGATALGEAALMTARASRKNEFLVPENISWEKKSVLGNYVKGAGLKIREIPFDSKTGLLDLDALKEALSPETAGLYIENPNFFGLIDDRVDEINAIVHSAGKALLVVGVDAVSLGALRSPGDYGADIVIGEGQLLGNAPNFGGPLVGIFACRDEHVRRMPGRIIGLTKDASGRRAFCMALTTREQHIRREKATSNICSNETLCSLASAVYLSLLGRDGLEKLARLNFERGEKLKEALSNIEGVELPFSNTPHFNQLVVRYTGKSAEEIHYALLERGVHGGLLIGGGCCGGCECALYGTTELHTDGDINKLAVALREAV
ncbi:MAG: aminomethyl-transferring glycine dehydrogenase [Thermoplasmata archaeon HGW-Thermoplasmata-1]|nr:MAG: aminomethyl-transferring glycine dehydrogenase [Thermoplasmata archaeon HGW-Thermoplasmata-1]